jgi:N-acetylglucosamine kinase-like BadF-type ATPase
MVAVLRAHDGLDRPTALREPVLEALGLSECQQLIDHVHCSMSFSDVAALAPLVVSVAEQGDPAAEDVVRVAAAALVEFATTAATRVLAGHDEGPLDAAFVGGLAVNPYYRSHIRTLLSQNSTVCRWVEPATRPVLGAVLMGAHHLQILSTWDASLLAKIDPFTQE